MNEEDKGGEKGLEQDAPAGEDSFFAEDQHPETEQQQADGQFALPALRKTGGGLGGKITVRGLAEGAMMTALTLILAVISLYVPLLNIIAPLLFPVPLALIVLRHGLRLGCLCAASVLLLSSMLLGFPHALFLFVQFGFLGLFFGWCFRQKRRAAITLFGGVMISSAAMLFSFVFPSLVAGISMEQYQQMAIDMLNEYVSVLQEQGAADIIMRGMTPAAYLAYMEALLKRLLPSMLVTSAMGLTLLCYVLMCKLLRRFGYTVSKLPVFTEWRLDWRFLWALIAALALAGLGSRLGYDSVARIGDNLLMVFSPVLLICGVSVGVWLLKTWRTSVFIKVLIGFLFIQLFGGAINIFIMVGVFDPLFDFRRRITRMREKRKAA